MKQVVKCAGCNKIIRRQGSFIAMLEDEMPIVIGIPQAGVKLDKKKIRLCRSCAQIAGYKVTMNKI